MKKPVTLLLALTALSPQLRAALTPVFEYKFPSSYSGLVEGAPVVDQSAGGHNGISFPRNGATLLALSDDIPPGATPGTKSLDLVTQDGSIRTAATSAAGAGVELLERSKIVEAGGFTMDVWFKGMNMAAGNTVYQKIMDDSGLEFLSARGSNTDGDANLKELIVRVGTTTVNTVALDADDGLKVDDWNHARVMFTVTDGSNLASVKGTVVIVLNGVVRAFPERPLTVNATYMGYHRPVSIGRHPHNDSEFYSGLVYNPSVYLGVEPIALPIFAMPQSGPAGFSVTIKDGSASAVTTGSVVIKLDGVAVPADVTKDGDLITASWFPAEPIPPGVHTVEATFADASGGKTETGSFNIMGTGFKPVFAYTFPASYDGVTELTDVADQSPANNDGVIGGTTLPIPLSEEVPPNFPATARSLNPVGFNGHILTSAKKLLSKAEVVANGGFTMEAWFHGMPPEGNAAYQKIIDYAGTEFISARGTDSDGDGSFGEVTVRLSSTTNTWVLDADEGLNPTGWNHITYTFTLTNAADINALAGNVKLNLNGKVSTFTNKILSNYGDTLDRFTGIGKHPANASEYYGGLLFHPSLSFGVKPGEDPIVSASATKDAGLNISISDSPDAVVDAESVVIKVDGEVVDADVTGGGGFLSAAYLPATPFTSGRHSVEISFKDADGDPHLQVRPLVIAGDTFTTLLDYNFPESYGGGANASTVYDLSPAANHATVNGLTAETPVELSNDVPAGAAAETMSLNYVTTPGSLVTTRLKPLTRSRVIETGGYTYDVWFKGIPTDNGNLLQKILDYAGTEYIAAKSTNADGDANPGEIIISVSNSSTFLVLDTDDGLDTTGWNHLVFTFKVTDESNPASIAGEATAVLNGVTITRSGNLSDYGDSFNRPLSVGAHPAGGENYRGLVYHPVVSLGVPPVTGGGDAALSYTLNGSSLVLTYTGVLQSSADLNAWGDVQDAASPHTVVIPASGKMFYRARPVTE